MNEYLDRIRKQDYSSKPALYEGTFRKCMDCVCGQIDEVRNCPITGCGLHKVRHNFELTTGKKEFDSICQKLQPKLTYTPEQLAQNKRDVEIPQAELDKIEKERTKQRNARISERAKDIVAAKKQAAAVLAAKKNQKPEEKDEKSSKSTGRKITRSRGRKKTKRTKKGNRR